MASSLYKTYLIVSYASYNRDTSEWKPWAHICWRNDARQHLYQIKFNEGVFQTAEGAEEFAMNAAKKWADDQPAP